jgi:tRNA/rRNA methyltransferase
MKTRPVELPGAEPIIPAARADVDSLVNHLVTALDEAEYFHPPEKRERMETTLKSILSRPGFSGPEVQTLRGVIASLQRRWLRKSGQQ